MKKTFLVLAVAFALVTIKFVHTRLFVKQIFGPSSIMALVIMLGLTLLFLLSYIMIDSRHREKVIQFWLVSISSAVAFLSIDLLAGFLLIEPLSPQLVPDEYRHHKLVPNASAKFTQRDFEYVQRNNSHGFRGHEVTVDKPDGTFRILNLGDSFTMGKGVEDNETFSVRLEEKLDDVLASCESQYRDIEVLNGGTDSYTPVLSYLYLVNELEKFEPDLIVLHLDNSDLLQEEVYRSIAVRDSAGRIIAVPGKQAERSFSDRFRDWIDRNLYITRLALYYLNKKIGYVDLTVRELVTQANEELIAHTLESDGVDRAEQWANIFESLRYIQSFAEERSMEFTLNVYPWGHQVSDDEWIPGRSTFMPDDAVGKRDYDRTILSMADRNGIRAISMYEAYQQYSGEDPLYFDFDSHMTAAGHELMASELSRQLLSDGLSEEICSR